MSYVVVLLFVFSELKREVIVHSVDISGIVVHHCLTFLFIIVGKYKIYLCELSKKEEKRGEYIYILHFLTMHVYRKVMYAKQMF